MAMKFLFANGIDSSCLYQGDLLVKNEALRGAIANAHHYYAEQQDYTHFIVLTQSCDLVRRDGKPPKSRYITLAAGRPLQIVVDRFLEKHRVSDIEFPFMVCHKEKEILAQQLLERLLHNTEDSYFFVRKGSCESVDTDLCFFLVLSVALRAAHYDTCLSAKVAQLDDIFAAKVGWLTGSLYSRIATPDVEESIERPEEYKMAFYNDTLQDRIVWLSPRQVGYLKDQIKKWKRDRPGSEIDRATATAMIGELPDEVTLIAQRAVNALSEKGAIDKAKITPAEAVRLLKSDFNLRQLVRSIATPTSAS